MSKALEELTSELARLSNEVAELRSAVVQLGGRLPENGAPKYVWPEPYKPISRIEGVNPGRMRRL